MTRHELRRARDPNGIEVPPPASTPGPIVGFNRVREQLGLPTR